MIKNISDDSIIGVIRIDLNSYYLSDFLSTLAEDDSWKSWIFESSNDTNHALVAASDHNVTKSSEDLETKGTAISIPATEDNDVHIRLFSLTVCNISGNMQTLPVNNDSTTLKL